MGVKVHGGPGYQVTLGGGADNDQAIARELFPALPYADVKISLHNLFAAFTRSSEPEESFLTFCNRHTIEDLRALCDVATADEVHA